MKNRNEGSQSNRDIRFIKPSKVKLSRRGHEILVYLGDNIIVLHRNFLDAVIKSGERSPKKRGA